ncbi:MAG: sulfotransferase [Bacteroidales bacterium]|nr:sulfotransferase [Bacteroidales bacterium]
MNNNENKITPIFVIGKNRSGTKWLSNILSRSNEIVSLQREEDYGINETNIFYQFPKIFGNLNSYNNYIPFIECFAQTNIFKLTGLDKQFLYRLEDRNYNEIFKSVMNQYAFNKGKKIWLQKSNTYILKDAISYFPNAIIILIERKLEDNIRSTIGLQFKNGSKRKNILKNVFIYLLEQKRIKKFRRKIEPTKPFMSNMKIYMQLLQMF